MKPNRTDPAHERAAEYLDSPRMTQRVVHGKRLSARIDGNSGTYRTTVQVGRKMDATCTCPSDLWPCKHVHAVRLTWDQNPESFFDLDALLRALVKRPKAQLIATIGELLSAQPEGLTLFGVPGFEPETEFDEYA